MDHILKRELVEYLKTFVSEQRLQLFDEKLNLRTRNITLVLEDVFQSRNISAAVRSADCFGIQDIHIIENKNNYVTDESVSLGAGKWINVIQHNKKENNTYDCIKYLKNEGYQIIATTPHKSDINLNDFDAKNNKIALLLGSELTGLSEKALELADVKMKINMYGFTESLNISVSAAICCEHLSNNLRKHNNWKLREDEKLDILLGWLRNTIKSCKKIEEKFLKNKNKF